MRCLNESSDRKVSSVQNGEQLYVMRCVPGDRNLVIAIVSLRHNDSFQPCTKSHMLNKRRPKIIHRDIKWLHPGISSHGQMKTADVKRPLEATVSIDHAAGVSICSAKSPSLEGQADGRWFVAGGTAS